uniref:Monocarboxylate transporter 12-like isoform X2 n=1 Tax=Crassostrea virginica TaxID=6565 RepID=A0A8B8EW71_CRAVI|nr:monocarboxylate transporter 12-like isoform X2 [Crassostrea virginica]
MNCGFCDIIGLLLLSVWIGMHSREPKDTVRGWLVVAACSASFFLFVGISCCLGLLELELSRLFGGPSSSLSAINAFYNGLGWGLAPLMSALTNFFSCRLLCACGSVLSCLGFLGAAVSRSLPVIIFCIGVLQGIGFSLLIVPSSLLIAAYFDKKRPLALILSVIGGGFGIVVFPHIFTNLNQAFGVKGTFLILSALSSHGMVFSALFNISLAKEKPNVWVILRQVHRTVFDGDLLRTPQYVVVTVAYLLVYAAYGIPYLFLPHKASEVDLSEDSVSLLVSIIGISNLTARFLMAIVASSSIPLGAGLFGFSSGIFISITPAVLLDLFGLDKLPNTLGSNFLVIGIGYLLGGPVMRHLSLVFSATDPVFYASAGCSGIATVIIMTAIYYKSIGGVMRIAYKRCACKIGTISPDDGPVSSLSTSVSSVGVYTISNSI